VLVRIFVLENPAFAKPNSLVAMITNFMNKILDVNKGDVLTFKASDNKFKLILCTSVYKERSPFCFTFAALTYSEYTIPKLEEITNCEFYGIGHRTNDYFKYSDKELDGMWIIHPEIVPYSLGSYALFIWRKDFLKFRNNFELICNLNIVDNLDKNGNSGLNSSALTVLDDLFINKLSVLENGRGQQKFKVKAILRY
jgi:hypothetical protein